jgi:hypothetical protein
MHLGGVSIRPLIRVTPSVSSARGGISVHFGLLALWATATTVSRGDFGDSWANACALKPTKSPANMIIMYFLMAFSPFTYERFLDDSSDRTPVNSLTLEANCASFRLHNFLLCNLKKNKFIEC